MVVCSAVGFYYSGSGAVMDLIKECDHVYMNDRFEIPMSYLKWWAAFPGMFVGIYWLWICKKEVK